jgi:hypothetical protein
VSATELVGSVEDDDTDHEWARESTLWFMRRSELVGRMLGALLDDAREDVMDIASLPPGARPMPTTEPVDSFVRSEDEIALTTA